MFSRILVVFLLAVVAQARAAIIKGTIVLNEVGGRPIANVQIIDSAHTGGPWASGSGGGFTLDYPERHPGQRVRLMIDKEGYVVVNDVQLDLALPADPSFSHDSKNAWSDFHWRRNSSSFSGESSGGFGWLRLR